MSTEPEEIELYIPDPCPYGECISDSSICGVYGTPDCFILRYVRAVCGVTE